MKFRRSLVLFALVSMFAHHVSAQETGHFKIAFGLNLIDNSNTTARAPWGVDNLAFSKPLYFGVDFQANKNWSFGVNAAFNQLENLGVESNFFGVNADANYYIIPNDARQFIDFYAILGGGVYSAFDGTGLTINPGLGFNYWFSDNIGANVTARANFDLKNEVIEVRNFYTYTLGLIWRPSQRF